MSAQTSKLPGAMIALAYLAAGLAMSVSWAQLRQVLEMQAGLVGGEFIAVAMPLALLFGGAVLWRMSGHLMQRSGVANLSGALCIVVFGALFLESVSIFSSTISFNLGVNNRLQTDMEQSANYRAVTAANEAAATAAIRLASDLQNMPENYRTESRRTATALADIMGQQRELTEASTTALGQGATQRTLNEISGNLGITPQQLKQRWSLVLAVGLSIIVLAVQVGLGATSDGHQRQKSEQGDLFGNLSGSQFDSTRGITEQEQLPGKKSQRLQSTEGRHRSQSQRPK